MKNLRAALVHYSSTLQRWPELCMSAWMADNHLRPQAGGVSLGLRELVAQMAVWMAAKLRQEGGSENGAVKLLRFCMRWIQISELPLGEVSLWAFFGLGIKLRTQNRN